MSRKGPTTEIAIGVTMIAATLSLIALLILFSLYPEDHQLEGAGPVLREAWKAGWRPGPPPRRPT